MVDHFPVGAGAASLDVIDPLIRIGFSPPIERENVQVFAVGAAVVFDAPVLVAGFVFGTSRSFGFSSLKDAVTK